MNYSFTWALLILGLWVRSGILVRDVSSRAQNLHGDLTSRPRSPNSSLGSINCSVPAVDRPPLQATPALTGDPCHWRLKHPSPCNCICGVRSVTTDGSTTRPGRSRSLKPSSYLLSTKNTHRHSTTLRPKPRSPFDTVAFCIANEDCGAQGLAAKSPFLVPGPFWVSLPPRKSHHGFPHTAEGAISGSPPRRNFVAMARCGQRAEERGGLLCPRITWRSLNTLHQDACWVSSGTPPSPLRESGPSC